MDSVHKKWLTERQVASITSLSLSSLQKMRGKHKGPAYFKIGRSVRYLEADVIAFMEARRINVSN